MVNLDHFLEFTQEIQKFRARNPVCQAIDFCIKNALKLTYEHLEHKKSFRRPSSLDPQEQGKSRGGEEGGGEEIREGEGKEEKGRDR
jgi:hypothetical protein